jgi:Zn-dependent protease
MASNSPRLFKVAGINIQLHWTFILLLLFALIYSVFIGILLFVVLVLLFLCVFLHELSHSITAKHNKIPVQKIILYPLGGGSVIDMDNISPQMELKISLAGPVSSFLMAFVFGMLVIFIPGGIVKYIVQLLFVLNLLLAVSNILPWFPLDGGRVLRSYLQKKNSFLKATIKTVKVSNFITVAFILFTIVFVGMESYSLIYKEIVIFFEVFIAIFLYGGAQAELQSAYIKEYTSDIPAYKLMDKNYIYADKETPVGELYYKIMKKHTTTIISKDGPNYYVLSRLPLSSPYKTTDSMLSTPISRFSVQIPAIASDSRLYTAMEKMQTYETNIVAVTKKGSLVGVVSRQHLESFIALHMSKSKSSGIQKPENKGNSKSFN